MPSAAGLVSPGAPRRVFRDAWDRRSRDGLCPLCGPRHTLARDHEPEETRWPSRPRQYGYERETWDRAALGARDDSRAVFGKVMFLVAVTAGFTAAGAYIGRDLSGGWAIGVLDRARSC